MTMSESMVPELVISLTSPIAIQESVPGGVWIATGMPRAELERLATFPDPGVAGDEAAHRLRGASIIHVAVKEGVVTKVTAWKGLLGLDEVFYCRLPSGGWYITDHFRNAVAMIPTSVRDTPDDALVAHYVSADLFDRFTYARGVDRLANGDRLDLDVSSGEVKRRNFSRHTSIATDEPMDVHLDRIDGALEDLLAPLHSADDVALGFSGGVDSTLLLAYLGDNVTPVTLLPGSPEFDAETEYAREALHLFDRSATEIQLRETDYLDSLATTIETHGMPLESYVVPVLASLYAGEWSTVIVGEGADSAFGSGRGIRRVASLLSGRSGRTALRALEAIPGAIGGRAKQVGEYAALFAEPPHSPNGYAARSLEYHGDNTLAHQVFGSDAIDAYIQSLVQGVDDRVELETREEDGFWRHIEMAQWRYLFSDLAMMGRHSAHAVGKREIEPFLSWRVISEHLRIPARNRYVRGLAGKWVLKELLKRRVPAYRANKRKLATALPFYRYYESGPLTEVWERYEVPDVFPAALRETLTARPSAVTWKAITHAIYQEHVAHNDSLQPHPSALSASWPLSTA
jgi:asparagine synthetase B (glutamine-hydrolysing)